MSHNHSGHDHDDLKGKNLGISIFLNILITIAQIIGGYVSGSLSLLSDALHNFSDVISLSISYIAGRLVHKKFTRQKTFGYKRAEVVAALINASILLGVGIILIQEAIPRFNLPVKIESSWVVILAISSILVNGGSVLLLRRDAGGNMNIKSAYLHLFSDMLTSVAVLVAGLIMYFFKIFWVDSVLTIFIAVYLIYLSWDLVIETLKVLMQFVPAGIDLDEIEKDVLQFSQIQNIHHVHVWQLDDKQIHFEGHIDFRKDLKLTEATGIIKQVVQLLGDKHGISHVILQPEIGSDDSKKLIVGG